MASPGGGRWDPLSNSDHSLRPRRPEERGRRDNDNKTRGGGGGAELSKGLF